MIQLFLYITTIQWSPGPLNILSFNNGLQGKIHESIKFCIGIAVAMSIQYSICGYGSQFILSPFLMPWVAGIGSIYIIWLGYHLIISKNLNIDSEINDNILSFKNGVIMQLCNPKGFVAALPVATIYFPKLSITGINILILSIIFGIICFCSVVFYTLIGYYFSKLITKPSIYRTCNIIMGLILIILGLSLDWEYIISPILI